MTRALGRAVAIGIVLAVWLMLSWIFASPRLALFPPPWAVAVRFLQLLQTELPADILASLSEALGGWVIGSAIAVIVGTLIGRSPAIAFVLEPAVNFLRYISPLAWVPLAILWFGIGYWGKASIIVLVSFFTVVVNTAHGMTSIDDETMKITRVLKLNGRQRVEVLFMSALPDILVGLRYALGVAWGGVVLSELVAGDVGLGALESMGGQSFDVAQIMVGMLTISLLGFGANALFIAAERRAFPWVVANRVPV